MRYQAIIQIVLVVVSLVIIFLVIQPKFESIKETEEEAASYNEAVLQVNNYNQNLQTLLDQANSFSQSDLDKLYTYLPESIDKLKVARDISIIVEKHNSVLQGIQAFELMAEINSGQANLSRDSVSIGSEYSYSDNAEVETDKLLSQAFEVEVAADYVDMKNILRDIERNVYPLKLIDFSYTPDSESELQKFKMTLETYAFGEVVVTDNMN